MALVDELLKAPDAVTKEGDRIRASLAAGTYGSQPQQAKDAAAGTPQITVAPASSVADFASPSDPFFNQPSIWQQNQNPAQLRQGLRLEELQTTAAARKFALEQAQKNAPMQEALTAAKLAHQEAATKALSTHEKTLLEHDTSSMNAVHGFLNDLHAPGAPKYGTPEYTDHFMETLMKNPDIVHSVGGREIVKSFAEKHDKSSGVTNLADREFKSTYGFPKSALEASDVQVGDYNPTTDTFTRNNKGTHVRVMTPAGKKAVMTTKAYEGAGGKYSGETAKARAEPIDKMELARKALNDPNSSEEHRAAARKLLSGE